MKSCSRVVASSALLCLACALLGQETPDPPSRVARLNYLDGAVSLRPASVTEWDWASLNAPLTNGDQLWTEADAHAELHVGATAIHLAELTAFAVVKLDGRTAQLSLTQGTVYLRIPRLEEDQTYELDTPSGVTTLKRTGDYRFDVSPDGKTSLITVRNGEAEVRAGAQTFTVPAGQVLRLMGTDRVTGELTEADSPDPWEEWCLGRDLLTEKSFEASDPYVSPEMTGAEDFAQYGDWSTDDVYGATWTPRGLPVGWAPYRFGHWAYIAPWGWTWIDDCKWGFAPFHFGRWIKKPTGWTWTPIPRGQHPVYAPAIVAFVNGRGAGRNIAWVPLGPGERYTPPYRASERYVQALNGSRASAPGRSFVNATNVTEVSERVFANASRVNGQTVRPSASSAIGMAPVSISDVKPSRQSLLGRTSSTDGNAASPPVAPRRQEAARSPEQQVQRVEPAREQQRQDADQQRQVQQRVDRQRQEQQRQEQQSADQQRQEQQRQEQQRQVQQRAEQQRQEQQRADQQRQEQQRQIQQRAEQQRQEQQRADQQRQEQQRQEQQRAEQQRAEQQRQEQYRQEQQRAEQQRQEHQRQEQQRAEQQRQEQQRQEQQRAEQQRQEQQRQEQQRSEQQRQEQQRQADEKKAEEARKKQQ